MEPAATCTGTINPNTTHVRTTNAATTTPTATWHKYRNVEGELGIAQG
jgi:hypothetical protein